MIEATGNGGDIPVPRTLCRVALCSLLVATLYTAVARGEISGDRDGSAPVHSSLTCVGEFWQNVHGGLRTGSWWNTLADASVEIVGTAVHAPAASQVFLRLLWVENRHDDRAFGTYTGAFNAVSGWMANDHIRLFEAYYEQSSSDRTWDAKVGQLAVDTDFMVSEYAGYFVNACFGPTPSQIAVTLHPEFHDRSGLPIYPVAAPGLWMNWNRSDATSWQTGLYYGGAEQDSRDNHGMTWTGSEHAGVVVFSEWVYRTIVRGHPITSRFGVSGYSGQIDDYAGVRRGEDRDAFVRGLFGVYGMADVALAKDATGRATWGGFTRIGCSPRQERSAVTLYGDMGLCWFGAFSRRPEDVLGAAVSATRFGSDFRALTGQAKTETAVEFTYLAKVTPRWSVQADLQLLLDPLASPDTGRRQTACVIGIRSTLSFGPGR